MILKDYCFLDWVFLLSLLIKYKVWDDKEFNKGI